jgi:hypothetical protein
VRKDIALALVIVALAGGFLLGRKLPAHHYEPWKASNLVYDTATGKICDPFKRFEQQAEEAKAANANSGNAPAKDGWNDAFDRLAAEQAESHIPSCD